MVSGVKESRTARRLFIFGVFGAVIILVSLFPLPALAIVEELERFLQGIIYYLMRPIAVLLNYLIYLLIQVAQYNDFANAEIVETGWKVLRDLSNMFFVSILLIIAIGTITKWTVINHRQNLRRLILMAILINFSKTITLFFIDISQVITLTFIVAVRDVLQADILTALGLDQIFNPVTQAFVNKNPEIGTFSFIVALIMVVIACLVVAVILIVFVVRIIALWLLIVFSPLAYLSSALPQTKKWYDQWWSSFGTYLTVAPVLSFMLWLIFAMVAGTSAGGGVAGQIPGAIEEPVDIEGVKSTTIISYLITAGLLIYSIRLAQQMGGAGGALAAQFAGKVQGYAKKVGNYIGWGKSGQGGVLGRMKSGALQASEFAGKGMIGFSGIPGLRQLGLRKLGGVVERTSAVARERQMRTRKKAEAEMLLHMGDEGMRKRMEQERILGFRSVSAPRRMAIVEDELRRGRYSERGADNKQKVSKEEVRERRIEYDKAGATEEQLKEFDIKSNLRGLNGDYKADEKGKPVRDEAGQIKYLDPEDAARARELIFELAPKQDITRDMTAAFPYITQDAITRYSSKGQIENQYEKLGPPERPAAREGLIDAFRQTDQEVKRLEQKLGENAEKSEIYRDARSRRNRTRDAFVNIHSQQAIDFNIVQNLNEAVDKMKESAHNDLELKWLKDPANVKQILGLTGQSLRRLAVSQNFDQEKKDVILDAIDEASRSTDKEIKQEGNRLVDEMANGPALTKRLWKDFLNRKELKKKKEQGGEPSPAGGSGPPTGGGAPGAGQTGGGQPAQQQRAQPEGTSEEEEDEGE